MSLIKQAMFLCILLLGACKVATESTYIFERVIDGDTFVASGERIRLWGIDAPEKNEPEAYAAKLYLEVLLENGQLACDFLYKDKYQRNVMKCSSNGHDIALDMVKMGMAKDYEKYSKGYYSAAQKEARDARIGIWSGSKI